MMKQVVVSGSFDNLRPEKCASWIRLPPGELNTLVWSDEVVQAVTGQPPRFPLEERLYFLQAVRYVRRAIPAYRITDPDELPRCPTWTLICGGGRALCNDCKRLFCASFGLGYQVIPDAELAGWPELPEPPFTANGRKKGHRHGLLRLAALRARALLRGSFRIWQTLRRHRSR